MDVMKSSSVDIVGRLRQFCLRSPKSLSRHSVELVIPKQHFKTCFISFWDCILYKIQHEAKKTDRSKRDSFVAMLEKSFCSCLSILLLSVMTLHCNHVTNGLNSANPKQFRAFCCTNTITRVTIVGLWVKNDARCNNAYSCA